jgi:hypothetical protein
MGRSIDLYSYDYEKLINKTLEVCKTDNRELVEKVLLTCGSKIGDRYVILNQEMWEDCSCYYNVANALDKIFNVDDSFGEIFCTWKDDNKLDKQELIQAIEMYQIEDALEIEFPPSEDD